MKTITFLCLVTLVTLNGCGRPQVEERFGPMFKDRAIVVLCDDTTGNILRVDTFAESNLIETIIYTNGPSVRFVCFGDLVNPDIPKTQISGETVQMQCEGGQIVSVLGNTLIFESALDTAFLEQVKETLANKALQSDAEYRAPER